MTEANIRQHLDRWANAVSTKNIDGATSLYAPDVVSFDINPPLRYAGAETKRQAWLKVFAAYPGHFSYEVPDPSITTEGDLAFVHSLNHVRGTLANGHTTDLWVRWTACFRRIDGHWLVVHDHVSVPADLEHGKAVTHLTP
ncbi:MAG TPA: nuclear transport factor 2 family protein [Myxococcaceae bacterium]|nr:nuclear transport factor 2 family protein [Myxococcaceae bacterium]